MGGIVCIDFIDMYDKENNKDLYEKLKEFMCFDRVKYNIFFLFKFGVVEIICQ